MSLSLEQVGAVLLALVILFAAGRLWYGKQEPWHPLPPDEGDSGDGPPGTV